MKKGLGLMVFPFAVILFLVIAALFTAAFTVIINKGTLTPVKQQITSDINKAEIYPATVTLKSLALSQQDGVKYQKLLLEGKSSTNKEPLHKATGEYLKLYPSDCVQVFAIYDDDYFFISKPSEGCSRVFSKKIEDPFKDRPSFDTYLTIPTQDPTKPIVLRQKQLVLK